MRYNGAMDRKDMPVRVTTLHHADADDDEYYARLSAEECIAMVWPMTLDAWKFSGEPFESRLRRDIVRLFRRERPGREAATRLPTESDSI